MTNIPKLIAANEARWRAATITPARAAAVDKVARKLTAATLKELYLQVQADTGVPWWGCAVIDERECDCDANANPAQGDPWNQMSRHVPRGRGPFAGKRAAFYDALVRCAPFAAKWKDWSAGGTLTILEMYNGTGYDDVHHEASPYIWGATDQEEWGKYVSDGHYEAHVWDTQLGCAAMLKRMMELDPSIMFAGQPAPAPAEPAPAHDLRWVQASLNRLGVQPPLVVDGSNGDATRSAVAAFQKRAGIAIDGVPGAATIAAIEQVLLPSS
jgi:lysozyme family protein